MEVLRRRQSIASSVLIGSLLLLSVFTSTPRAYATPYNDAVLADGPVAYWTFDEAAGATTAADVAGSNDGTYTNGPTLGQPGPSLPGIGGTAVSFDGLNDFVEVPDSPLWAFGASNFSIDLWANFSSAPGGSIGNPGAVFIGNDEGSGTTNKWFFALGGGKLNFHINGPGITSVFLVQAPFTPTVGVWNHLAVTRNGNTYTMYVDGTSVGTAMDSQTIPDVNAPLTIGQAEGFFTHGLLDDLAIYDTSLTASQIESHFNAASTSVPVGGEILPIDMTSLMVAGALTNAYWILPMLGVLAAIFAVARRMDRSISKE